jgi:uncharacterized protein (DUF1778 family)
MANSSRASIIVRCSFEQAAKIRHFAAVGRRTVAGYMLSILERNLTIDETFHAYTQAMIAHRQIGGLGQRTAIHLRCSSEEADRIRRAAAAGKMSLSLFVVFVLERSWRAKELIQTQK